MRDLNRLLGEKGATIRHFLLRYPHLVFPIALLRGIKRDIGENKRGIFSNKRAIVPNKRAIVFAKRGLIFADARRFPKFFGKKSFSDGLFSHLKAGKARPKEFPPKILRT